MPFSIHRLIVAFHPKPWLAIFALVAPTLFHLSDAAASPGPQGNGTNSQAVGFVSDPKGRGTISLVTSCFLTLFTCVWTAIHFNARPAQSIFTITFERLLWMTLAIVSPETVLFCALEQWVAARDLQEAVNLIGGRAAANAQLIHTNSFGAVEDPCGSYICTKPTFEIQSTYAEGIRDQHVEVSSKHTFTAWGKSQAFYAATGGFAVDSSSFSDISKVVFTPAGILELARAGILPDVTEDEIRGMSTQDGIAKIGVCVQIAWFFIQSLARVCVDLPLTLLELHVLAHIISAFLMYGLWYRKPYTGSSPYICKDIRIIDMAALFCLEELPVGTRQKDREQKNGMKLVSCALQQNPDSFGCSSAAASIQRCSPPLLDPPADHGHFPQWISALTRRPTAGSPGLERHSVEAKDEERLGRAQRAATYLGKHGSHFSWYQDESTGAITFPAAYLVKFMPDMNVHGQLYRRSVNEHAAHNERTIYYAWSVFYMIYGGVFLGGWNFEFPTTLEMWLWRASSIFLVLYGTLGSLTLAITMQFMSTAFIAKVRAKFHEAGKKTGLFDIVQVLLLFVILIPWIFARWYLTVESLISLRKAPAGTYETVNWTNRIPHIT